MWARLRAKTNEEMLAEARADPEALPVEDRRPGSLGPGASAREPRAGEPDFTGQADSLEARIVAKPVRGRVRDSARHAAGLGAAPPGARSGGEILYLEVIAREPEAVRRALDKASASSSRRSRRPLSHTSSQPLQLWAGRSLFPAIENLDFVDLKVGDVSCRDGHAMDDGGGGDEGVALGTRNRYVQSCAGVAKSMLGMAEYVRIGCPWW